MKLIILSVLLISGVVLIAFLPNRPDVKNKPFPAQQPDSAYYGSGSSKETVFEFSNGKRICLSGWMKIQDERALYSDFILRDCETGEELGSRELLKNCEFVPSSDTLWVNHLEFLAMGEDHALVRFPWKIGAYYYSDDGFKYSERLNENLRYDQQTIETVLKEYETVEWRTQQEDWAYVNTELMPLANRLMIAAISGSQRSEVHFKAFKTRAGLDAHLTVEYTYLERILEYAKARN